MERIVVGVDGSEQAQRALQWAVDEARRRGAKVEAIHAWHLPYVGAAPYAAMALEPDSIEAGARRTLDEAVDAADTAGLEPPVERVLVEGPAARALLDAGKGATLLVVGSRGRGGFAGLLLGSVSQQVAHHAPCPVVILPAD
jgi:nucleotide-binding universal stress UspA family protein